MRYQITITGQLDTWTDEAGIRADAHLFLPAVEMIHSSIVPDSVQLTDVVRMPDPEPVSLSDLSPDEAIARLETILAQLKAGRVA